MAVPKSAHCLPLTCRAGSRYQLYVSNKIRNDVSTHIQSLDDDREKDAAMLRRAHGEAEGVERRASRDGDGGRRRIGHARRCDLDLEVPRRISFDGEGMHALIGMHELIMVVGRGLRFPNEHA